MSAIDDTPADLTKVDSAISGLSSSPVEQKIGHRRTSSSVPGVFNINDLGMSSPLRRSNRYPKLTVETEKEGKDLEIAQETQKLNW